ncbi:MAG: xanthan lyase [Verrucomicrobiales bacterium]
MSTLRIVSLFSLFAALSAGWADSPSFPKPGQVDNPGMIRFIKPDPGALPGIVVDDTGAKLVGRWKHSVHTPPFVGVSYIHDMKEAKGEKSATFVPDLPRTGRYEVRMSHNSNVRRANSVPVTIRHADGESIVTVNEGKLFRSLGTFRFKKGKSGSVIIGTAGTEGKYVIVDAIQFLPVEGGKK